MVHNFEPKGRIQSLPLKVHFTTGNNFQESKTTTESHMKQADDGILRHEMANVSGPVS